MGPHDDTDDPTPAMLAQLQHELTALPNFLQSSPTPEAEPVDSPANAPPTPPPEQSTTQGPAPSTTKSPTSSLASSNTDSTWQPRPYLVITPSNSSSPRWQQLIQDPTELDILSYFTGLSTDFQAGTLNIGGFLRERSTDIAYSFAATQMDYLCLQDTRQTKREGLAIANTIRTLLPPGTLILQAPIAKTRPSDPPPIGGQMVIISNCWSHHANHWYADPTQRGLLTGITLSNKHIQLRILGSYWPVPHAANQHTLSLHAHVMQYLHQHNPLSDCPEQDQHCPLTYIQGLITRETHKHQRNPGNQTILMGDLNSSWLDSDKGGTHPALHRWANQMGWCNPSRTITDHLHPAKICTNWTSITPVSWIDHILTFQGPTMPQLLGLHLAHYPTTISDKHRLFWNSFQIPGGPPQQLNRTSTMYHRRTRKVPNIFKDQHTKDQFQINMQEWLDTHPCPVGADLTPETASTYLQDVSQASTAVGLGGIQ